MHRVKHVFAPIKDRMDISDGEEELGPDFLAPIALPEVEEGGTDEAAPQGEKTMQQATLVKTMLESLPLMFKG